MIRGHDGGNQKALDSTVSKRKTNEKYDEILHTLVELSYF